MSRLDDAARARGYAHAYHEQVITGILHRARGFVHRSRRHVTRREGGPATKGDLIREKIAANAQMRFEIAEAMKAEAGVKAHDLIGERDGGIAWSDRASILAPAGENRLQLATLAHECGHIFLHGVGTPGCFLPGHVKEMEAESYAHQAFVVHGMRMPKRITAWGRAYVGQWVDNDRAVGIPIDPRAEAYAKGLRSPYEPLRVVPQAWRGAGRSGAVSAEVAAFLPRAPSALLSWLRDEALPLIERMPRDFIRGILILACVLLTHVFILNIRIDLTDTSGHVLPAMIVAGLLWTCLATAWRARKRCLRHVESPLAGALLRWSFFWIGQAIGRFKPRTGLGTVSGRLAGVIALLVSLTLPG